MHYIYNSKQIAISSCIREKCIQYKNILGAWIFRLDFMPSFQMTESPLKLGAINLRNEMQKSSLCAYRL